MESKVEKQQAQTGGIQTEPPLPVPAPETKGLLRTLRDRLRGIVPHRTPEPPAPIPQTPESGSTSTSHPESEKTSGS